LISAQDHAKEEPNALPFLFGGGLGDRRVSSPFASLHNRQALPNRFGRSKIAFVLH
jgi:hypothetical protein